MHEEPEAETYECESQAQSQDNPSHKADDQDGEKDADQPRDDQDMADGLWAYSIGQGVDQQAHTWTVAAAAVQG